MERRGRTESRGRAALRPVNIPRLEMEAARDAKENPAPPAKSPRQASLTPRRIKLELKAKVHQRKATTAYTQLTMEREQHDSTRAELLRAHQTSAALQAELESVAASANSQHDSTRAELLRAHQTSAALQAELESVAASANSQLDDVRRSIAHERACAEAATAEQVQKFQSDLRDALARESALASAVEEANAKLQTAVEARERESQELANLKSSAQCTELELRTARADLARANVGLRRATEERAATEAEAESLRVLVRSRQSLVASLEQLTAENAAVKHELARQTETAAAEAAARRKGAAITVTLAALIAGWVMAARRWRFLLV